ncbi:hypothetical protein G9F71_008700 [Clostridium sp. FP2]|nr:hypothetical protein [Clostridium sp. FP2]MBZ9622932.1 hypothetical protein [Clostridium sp. FP2]
MVVFYTNIINKIASGTKHGYSRKSLVKLDEWLKNDIRTNAQIDKEKKF